MIMSQFNGEKYCDFIRCHLRIAPKDPRQVNRGNSNYHGECLAAESREKQAAVKPVQERKTA